jgi:HPr kinase/phosphorylase
MRGAESEGGPARLQIHASCVALSGAGVLLRGGPGAGKSDLALRLVDGGGLLVADDLCEIRREGGRLLADLPAAVDPSFRGRIALRGIGFLTLPCAGATPLSLVADLEPAAGAGDSPGDSLGESLGEAVYLGIALPLVVLDPFQPSAPARLRLLAKVGAETIMRAP